MNTRFVSLVFVIVYTGNVIAQDAPVFSGPQIGEVLAPFDMVQIGGEDDGKRVNLVDRAKGGPLFIMFVHERTRPTFGLTNVLTRFAAAQSKRGLTTGVCMLTNDATESESWLRRISQHLTEGIVHGISSEGLEGPGAYGLNRNVALTVLVGKENRVTANFALVQPSVQADGPKILKAVAEALGMQSAPAIATFARRGRGDAPMQRDPRLQRLLRPLWAAEGSAQEIKPLISAVNDYLRKNPRARAVLGQMARQVISNRRIESIASKDVREQVRQWARQYGRQGNDRAMAVRSSVREAEIRSLLRPVIAKTASKEEVTKAAESVEARMTKDRSVRADIGRRSRLIVDSGRLKDYGTPTAQAFIKKWAKEHGPKKTRRVR